MDNLTKIEENRQWNARFLRAFDYLCEDLRLNQAELAKKMGTNSSLISAYRKGIKKASEDIMGRLKAASSGRIYMAYLLNRSDYMLVSSMSDAEYIENESKAYNPDYNIIHTEDKKDIPSWADALIFQQTRQAAIIEDLYRQIKKSNEELAKLRSDMQRMLQTSNYQIQTPRGAYLSAAEPESNE